MLKSIFILTVVALFVCITPKKLQAMEELVPVGQQSLAKFLPAVEDVPEVDISEEWRTDEVYAQFWAMPMTPLPPCDHKKIEFKRAGDGSLYAQLSEDYGTISWLRVLQGGTETRYRAHQVEREQDGTRDTLERSFTPEQLLFIWRLIKLNTLARENKRANGRTLRSLFYSEVLDAFDEADRQALRTFIGGYASRLPATIGRRPARRECALL